MGGSLSSGFAVTLSASHGTDHLRVVNVAPSAVVSVASALSPGSLLFPFSDSGFASLSAVSSSRPLSLPPPLSSSSSLASSSPASASFLSSLPPPSPLPPTPAFPSPVAPPSFSSRFSFSALASLPPPPPGFPPLPPSVSPPLCSLPPRLLRSLLLFLLSVLPLQQARLPLLSFPPLPPLQLAPLPVPRVLPQLPLAPRLAMQASLLSLVHHHPFLRTPIALRPLLPLLSQQLRILHCPTPFTLRYRYVACTNIWWTSSRRLRARRRLLHLLTLSLRSSLPLRRLLISLCFLRGLRESALLSLRLIPASRPCSLVAVRSLSFCLLVTPSIPPVVRLRWAPLLQSTLLC